MIKMEFMRACKSNKTKLILLFLLVLVSYDLYLNWEMIFLDYYQHPDAGGKPEGLSVMHPCFASFVSSSSLGHLPQIILKWILPVYVLFLYSDSYILEKKLGYYNILLTKASRVKAVLSKFAVSFLVPFFVMLIAVLFNFLLANIIFRGGLEFMGMEEYYERFRGTMYLSMIHPYVAYCIYMIGFSAVVGFCGVLCTGICFLAPNYILAYPIAFFIWFILTNLPMSIMSLTQSFAMYSDREIASAAVIYLSVVLIVAIGSFYYKVKCDER